MLFASWHSRQAPGVEPARDWLKDRRIRAVRIAWQEDIRHWHPGQEWLLGGGGFGVFDPGINALSILTRILRDTVMLDSATMQVPQGRASPLAAKLKMYAGAVPIDVVLDFLQTGPQTWNIEVDTDGGTLRLSQGGSVVEFPGKPPEQLPSLEYPRLYARFAELIAAGRSDVDIAPLRLVADAFLIAEREITAPFSF